MTRLDQVRAFMLNGLTMLLVVFSMPVSAQGPYLIVAVGDSITSGYPDIYNANGCHACGGYTPYLESTLDGSGLPSTVFNYAIAGDRAEWATVPSSKRGSNQIPRAFQSHDPDFMLYHFGTNDLWRYSPATVVESIRVGVEAMIDGGTTPIVGTLLPDTRSNNNETKEIPEANQRLRTLLDQMSIEIADHYYAPSASNPVSAWDDLLPDGLHPERAGRIVMAGVWYDSVVAAIEKKRRLGAVPAFLVPLLLDD